jgi:hypothetical protein
MKRVFRRRWVLALLFIIALAGGVLVLALRPARAFPVLLLRGPSHVPPPRLSLFNRLVPMRPSWFWLHRLKQAVLGRPRAVNFTATFLAVSANQLPAQLLTALGPPQFRATNGVQAWLLPNSKLDQVRLESLKLPAAEVVSSARISTADEIQASLFSGQSLVLNGHKNSVGISLDCFPLVRRQVTDLTLAVRFSEPVTNSAPLADGLTSSEVLVRTNLDVSGRMQLPRGQGLFLLDAVPAAGNKRFGVILTATVPP